MSSWENQTFTKAAQDAGITGEDWQGNRAIKDFSHYYHDSYPNEVRKEHGYDGIREIAEEWWSRNHRRYTGQSFGSDAEDDE